jgi:hypothetical protein
VGDATEMANKTVTEVRDYIAAFLDSNLRDRPMDVLLTGTSSDYSDAQVITHGRTIFPPCAVSRSQL